jgi:hypothetical protein
MSSVIFEFACRINSCTTFTPSPLVISSVANDLLKVCQPMCLVIFARFAAGRSCRISAESNQYGRCPDVEGDAKTQSWSARYGVSSRHICRAVTRASGMGIVAADGRFLRLVRCLLTLPRVGVSHPPPRSMSHHLRPLTSERRSPVTAATRTATRMAGVVTGRDPVLDGADSPRSLERIS